MATSPVSSLSLLIIVAIILSSMALLSSSSDDVRHPVSSSDDLLFQQEGQQNDQLLPLQEEMNQFERYADPRVIPQQIHIAFAGDHAMTVSWLTIEDTDVSVVLYGTSSQVYDTISFGNSSTYYESYDHHVVLSQLLPETTYYYVCGDNKNSLSKEYSFTTPPDAPKPFTVAVFGDMGIRNSEDTQKTLIAEMDKYSWVYHVGDFAYADDRFEWTYELIWNQFMSQIEPITANRPYMICPGNHEATCYAIGSIGCTEPHKNFTAYRSRFRMPAPESLSTSGNMWFSFNYSYVHFVSISTETDYPHAPEGRGTLWNTGPFGPQLEWLEADLAAANNDRDAHPWIIVVGHRPLYSSELADFPVNALEVLREAVEELFHRYGVDMYICGHVHAYERMWPIYKGKAVQKDYFQPNATTYVVIGNAGNIEGLSQDWVRTDPDWLASRNDQDFGYALLHFPDSSTLHWELHRSGDNALLDEFDIRK